MPDTPKENEIKYNRFLTALNTLAPDKTFGGVTVSAFSAQVANSNAPRETIAELQDQVKQQETNRNNQDAVTMKMCEQIKNGVIADPDFGDDSALYEALGYIKKSDRKSGLTRKKKTSEKK